MISLWMPISYSELSVHDQFFKDQSGSCQACASYSIFMPFLLIFRVKTLRRRFTSLFPAYSSPPEIDHRRESENERAATKKYFEELKKQWQWFNHCVHSLISHCVRTSVSFISLVLWLKYRQTIIQETSCSIVFNCFSAVVEQISNAVAPIGIKALCKCFLDKWSSAIFFTYADREMLQKNNLKTYFLQYLLRKQCLAKIWTGWPSVRHSRKSSSTTRRGKRRLLSPGGR